MSSSSNILSNVENSGDIDNLHSSSSNINWSFWLNVGIQLIGTVSIVAFILAALAVFSVIELSPIGLTTSFVIGGITALGAYGLFKKKQGIDDAEMNRQDIINLQKNYNNRSID